MRFIEIHDTIYNNMKQTIILYFILCQIVFEAMVLLIFLSIYKIIMG